MRKLYDIDMQIVVVLSVTVEAESEEDAKSKAYKMPLKDTRDSSFLEFRRSFINTIQEMSIE